MGIGSCSCNRRGAGRARTAMPTRSISLQRSRRARGRASCGRSRRRAGCGHADGRRASERAGGVPQAVTSPRSRAHCNARARAGSSCSRTSCCRTTRTFSTGTATCCSDASLGERARLSDRASSGAARRLLGAIALRQRRGAGRDRARSRRTQARPPVIVSAVGPRTAADLRVARARAAPRTAREPRGVSSCRSAPADVDPAGRLARELLQAHPELLRGDGVAAAREPALLLGVIAGRSRCKDVTEAAALGYAAPVVSAVDRLTHNRFGGYDLCR